MKKHLKKEKIIFIIFSLLLFSAVFFISILGNLRIFLPYYPNLTGFPFSSKQYLILFQNNNELRPTGGFISAFAILKFQSGFPVQFKFEDVYGTIDDHDYIAPPYPMENLLKNEWYKGYTFRDANFYPDFSTSANELIKLYSITRPTEKVNGIISINFSVLEQIIKLFEPINIEGKNYTSNNLFEYLEHEVNNIDRHNLESLNERKSVLSIMFNKIIYRTITNPFRIRRLSDLITSSLSSKEIQLFFTDKSLSQLVSERNWDGKISPPTESATNLHFSTANLGGMKSDRYISRNLKYEIKFDQSTIKTKSSPTLNFTLKISHQGIENIPLSGIFTGYFRLFTNPNSPEQDWIIKLNPGESQEFKTTIPLNLKLSPENKLEINLIKQSGTADFIELYIEFPRGYTIESDTFQARENLAIYRGILNRDQKLSLKLLPDELPPRIIFQELSKLNEIKILFNEDLNLDFASDPFAYSITDLNKTNPKTDKLTIKNIKATPREIIIQTSGMTNQPEEHYSINLKNLRDLSGNLLTIEKITTVQRLKP